MHGNMEVLFWLDSSTRDPAPKQRTECQDPGDKDGPETQKAGQKGLRGQACFLPRGLLRTLRDPRDPRGTTDKKYQ